VGPYSGEKVKDILVGIWKNRFQRYLTLALLLFWVLMLFQPSGQIETESQLHFFYSETCTHCQDLKPYLTELEQEYDVTFQRHDVASPEVIAFLQGIASEQGVDIRGVPVTVIGDRIIEGYDDEAGIGAEIRTVLAAYVEGKADSTVESGEAFNSIISLPFIGEIDVLSYSLPVLAILLGLVDGFNPCAMWVLVYLISIIISMNDRRKIWLLVGSFVLASGVLYYLFMTAWLNAFLFLGYLRPITLAIGLAAIGFGIVSIKSFLEMKGPLVCEVTDASSRKKTMQRIDEVVKSPLTWGTVGGIIVLAFVVNSIEFACSAALPAIFTQVLAISDVSTIQHYLYILLYVLFFMLDDLVIFGLAAFAINSSFGEKYMKICKIIGGILLLVIGLILTFAPGLLQ
jgi:thiol-disulfide isomerase/thioredoxin